MIERLFQGWPGVPSTPEQRRERFRGRIENAVPKDELALKRLAGKRLQARMSAELLNAARRTEYEREAMATAHLVTQEDFDNAN